MGHRRTSRARRAPPGLLLLVLALQALPVGAQEAAAPGSRAPEAPAASSPAPGALAARRAALTAEIAEVRQRLEALSPSSPDAAAALGSELDLLEQIDHAQARQMEALRRAGQLTEAEAELELKVAAGASSPLADPPPYPLALADAVASALRGQAERRAKIQAAVGAAEKAILDTRRRLEAGESKRRLAKEAAARAGSTAEAAGRARSLRLAELESRLATARHELAEVELANLKSELALQKQSEEFAARTLRWIESNLQLDRDELQQRLAELEKREFDLRRAIDAAGLELASTERRFDAVQQRADATVRPGPELLAELEARRLARSVAQRRVALRNEQLQRLAAERALWQRRYDALAGTVPKAQLRTWEEEIRSSLEDLGRQRLLAEARLAELRGERVGARERAAAARPDEARWIREQEQELAALVGLYEADLASLSERRAGAERTLGVIRDRVGTSSLSDRLSQAGERVVGVWRTELLAVDDRPITVGKIVTALLLFATGIVFSRVVSRALAGLLSRRFAMDEGAMAALQGLSFYVLLVLFFLFALRTVNIPLTAFTVLGGALAIGVGFGSQNIVNNFISGLILMVERPIKVGDIVEIEGVQGRVERIGPRSTRVRRFDNIHIIVPNSAFLERNVVNWTLSDDVIRTELTVGVAYGSPTREVQRLVRKVLGEHEVILKHPEPDVFFVDFGESSLNFRCFFWLRVRSPADRRRVESDVRYRIDDLFREHGITIAFPQRDVHFDADKPIAVRLLDSRAGEGEAS